MSPSPTLTQAPSPQPPRPRRVLLLGATGTIGRATTQALLRRGHALTCLLRAAPDAARPLPAEATVRVADLSDPEALARDGLRGERFDVWVSCLASRNGAPQDAWAVELALQQRTLQAAQQAGATQALLLSAICVQKPRLAFQHAKLAFERVLMDSGLQWTIVRPTAFFKSLSGQVQRVRAGKPFVMFGDGRLTACKPIADEDLAEYLADCLDDPARAGCVLPIGGPGPAITPREQGDLLFSLLGRPPRYRRVPVAMMDGIVGALSLAERLLPSLAPKAEFARIGRYYATESMLVWDAARGCYDAKATPETGRITLAAHYDRLLRGEAGADLGEHAVF